MRVIQTLLGAMLMMSLIAPCVAIHPPGEEPQPLPAPPPTSILATGWDRLLPESEREHFSLIPPPPLHDYLAADEAATQQGSARINTALEGKVIRLPGYIVPLHMTPDGLVSEFFLVPYVGACIHVPPPPPNQMVYIQLEKAMPLSALYEPYWVTGTVRTHDTAIAAGTAPYSMHGVKVEPYKT
jgi:uncharacterized protein